MAQIPMWRRYLQFLGPNIRRDVDDELQFHLEMRTQELVETGLTFETAQADALREFGNLHSVHHELVGIGRQRERARDWRDRLETASRTLRHTIRRLRRSAAFSFAVVGTLTVGLAAFATVYAAVDKVLIEPLPYDSPDDLYVVWRDYGWFDLKRGWLGGPDITTLNEAGGVIQEVAGIRWNAATLTAIGAEQEPQDVAVMTVTPNLYSLLGVRPALGRGFASNEVGPGRPPVAVLTHDLWRQRFGSDPSVIDEEIRLNGQIFTVIGVMARDFRFVQNSSLGPARPADIYTTFEIDLAAANPGAGSYAGLLRARVGSPPESVLAAVEEIGKRVDERDFDGLGLRLYSVGLKGDLVAPVRPALLVLGSTGLLLVAVLLVNLATLLLVRAAQREREFAITRALGANRTTLTVATLMEACVLGTVAGLCGAFFAIWGTKAMVALSPLDLPRRESITVDWDVAAVVIGLGATLGLLAGLVPANWATRTPLATLLAATSVRGGGGHGRMRRGMVVVQVALSLVLLSAGGLVVRSFGQLLRSNPGFDPAGVQTLRILMPAARYPGNPTILALHERINEELAALPGVEFVGAASALPLSADPGQNTFSLPGAPGNTGEDEHDQPLIDVVRTRPGYFEALGIPVLGGRTLGESVPNGVREALIDRTLAAEFFPSGDPIGAPLIYGGDSLRIVGVVEHARQYDVYRDGRPQVYLRTTDYPTGTLSWVMRTNGSPSSLIAGARAAVSRADPELAISDIRSMDEVVGESLSQQRLSAVLIAGFSTGALLLAAMGLFGVVSGSVTRRRNEMAVRLALGAEHGPLLRLVVGEGMVLVLLGLLVGLPGIYLSARIIGGLLIDVSPYDPLTFGAVVTGLLGIALLACYLPARRVTQIEPAGLLRRE